MKAFPIAAIAALAVAAPFAAAAQEAGPSVYGTLGYAHNDLDGVDVGSI